MPHIDLIDAAVGYDPIAGTFWRKHPVRSGKWTKAGRTSHGYHRMGITPVGDVFAHRIAWLLYYRTEPPHVMDHINRDKSDNRITNLRGVTSTESARNRGVYARSGLKGVHKRPDRAAWYAVTKPASCRLTHLGVYPTAHEAAVAVNVACAVIDPRCAVINHIPHGTVSVTSQIAIAEKVFGILRARGVDVSA